MICFEHHDDATKLLEGKGAKLHVDETAIEELIALATRSITDFAPIPPIWPRSLPVRPKTRKRDCPQTSNRSRPCWRTTGRRSGSPSTSRTRRGDRFFRSSLIQTAFYSLFAAWILWDRTNDPAPFDLEKAQAHLRIPFLEQLFYDIRHPHYLRELDLARHLERAVATLNRLDRKLFSGRMSFPTVDDESPAVAAITYFYEPFLEAFDPQLRDELGVWYTPPEIVRYQVRRIHHILKTDLHRPRGLADPAVVVLDPCCGTGAYLLEVARCIAEELRREGDADARGLAGRLLRVGLAVLHAPAYQADHRSALSADWAHLPVPKDAALFGRLAVAGELVARLLDANSDARDQVFAVLGEERAAHLAQLCKRDGSPIGPEDLKVTVNDWGGAKGRWVPRPFSSEEDALPAWGECTGDLYIADDVLFSNVPESVWRYELGGYPVLKKWLGYRQADRRDGEPLTADERRWFRSIVQRIAALLALSERLDELYSASSEGAFTAAELGIER